MAGLGHTMSLFSSSTHGLMWRYRLGLSVAGQSSRQCGMRHPLWQLPMQQDHLCGGSIPLLPHQHHTWRVSRKGEVLHGLDALYLLEGERHESAPVEGRDEHISCLIANKLCLVGRGGTVHDICDVCQGRHPRSAQLPLDEAETPVRREKRPQRRCTRK